MFRKLCIVAALAGCYSPNPPTGAPCVADAECPSGLVCSPATHSCEHTAVPADAPSTDDDAVDAPQGSDAPPPPFAFRRRITIKNASASTMPAGFTIRIPVGQTLAVLIAQGKLRADFADLRVIGDVAGERDRIVDPDTGPAPPAVSFSLATSLAPGDTTADFAFYYGAPAATGAPQNGTAVFQVYDDFATGIASTWLVNDAPSVSGGKLVLRAGHADGLTTTAAADGLPIVSAVEVIARVVDPNSDPTPTSDGTFFYWVGYQHTGDFSPSDPWAVWIARGKGAVHGEQKSPVGCEAECDGPSVAQNTLAHYYVVERDTNATRFSLDGTLSFTAAVTNSTDYSVIVRNFMMASDVQVDYIRARARVSPDPTITVGAEQPL